MLERLHEALSSVSYDYNEMRDSSNVFYSQEAAATVAKLLRDSSSVFFAQEAAVTVAMFCFHPEFILKHFEKRGRLPGQYNLLKKVLEAMEKQIAESPHSSYHKNEERILNDICDSVTEKKDTMSTLKRKRVVKPQQISEDSMNSFDSGCLSLSTEMEAVAPTNSFDSECLSLSTEIEAVAPTFNIEEWLEKRMEPSAEFETPNMPFSIEECDEPKTKKTRMSSNKTDKKRGKEEECLRKVEEEKLRRVEPARLEVAVKTRAAAGVLEEKTDEEEIEFLGEFPLKKDDGDLFETSKMPSSSTDCNELKTKKIRMSSNKIDKKRGKEEECLRKAEEETLRRVEPARLEVAAKTRVAAGVLEEEADEEEIELLDEFPAKKDDGHLFELHDYASMPPLNEDMLSEALKLNQRQLQHCAADFSENILMKDNVLEADLNGEEYESDASMPSLNEEMVPEALNHEEFLALVEDNADIHGTSTTAVLPSSITTIRRRAKTITTPSKKSQDFS